MNAELYYPLSRAAHILGVSESTVRRWGASGRLVERRHPTTGRRTYTVASVTSLRALLWGMKA